MSFQRIIIAGNLGRDPEIRHTNSGKQVANFSVAVSERKDDTTWFRCVAFDKTAQFCEAYLRKGSKVLVEGRMSERSWEDRDGNKRTAWELVANTVRGLDSRENTTELHPGAHGGQSAALDDEIPF